MLALLSPLLHNIASRLLNLIVPHLLNLIAPHLLNLITSTMSYLIPPCTLPSMIIIAEPADQGGSERAEEFL